MITLTENDDVFEETLTGDLTLYAGAGDDRVVLTDPGGEASPYTVIVHGEAGDDQVLVWGGANAFLYGGDGDDNLYSEFGEAEAYGGAGDDTISLWGDSGYADGGAGNDEILVGDFSSADGGDGDDVIEGWGFLSSGRGGNGSDIIVADGAQGGAGDDVLSSGEFEARGGEGSDVLFGQYVLGDAGNDILDGLNSNTGGAGRDAYFPFKGLYYFEYDDMYYSEYGVNEFEAGVDVAVLPFQVWVVEAFTGRANEVVSTEAGTTFDFDGDGTGDYTSSSLQGLTQADFLVERLFDSAFPSGTADSLLGEATQDFLYGGGGDDVLSGGGGIDFVFGGFGDDTLSGNSGDDLVVGHGGNDRLYGGSGDDELDAGDGDDIASGSTGDDFAYGGDGDDLLAGNDGNDRLLGERGNDRLNGGAGNDTMDGGEGNDTLIGGTGKDIMIGGAGADQFLFMPGDSRPGGGVRDVITDFTSGEDTLDLRALGVTDAATQVSYQMIGSGMILHVDLDGDGQDSADFAVQLTGVWSLAAGDILL